MAPPLRKHPRREGRAETTQDVALAGTAVTQSITLRRRHDEASATATHGKRVRVNKASEPMVMKKTRRKKGAVIGESE